MGTQYYYPSGLYEHFQTIPPDELHALLRFFHRYEQEIELLPVEEGFIIRYACANALFDLGDMDAYLGVCQGLLEDAIIHNIQYVPGSGSDVYIRSLYQKALAHYRLQQTEQAARTAWELARIEPYNKTYRALLRRCLMAQRPTWVRDCFALGIFVGLLAIAFSFANILFLEAFYAGFSQLLHQLEYMAFILAASVLLLGFLGHWYSVEKGMRRLGT